MSPISAIRGSIVGAVGRAPRDRRASESRALIPLQPIERGDTPPRARPQATFLAHLIATKDQVPQTRERRRAEPQDAIAVYAAATAGPAAPSGSRLSYLI